MATHVILYGDDTTAVVEGKFLQLTWRGEPYLLFAPRARHRYHNQLLAEFLAAHGLAHRWAGPETLVVEDAEVRVGGGGRFRLDAAARRLELWDASQAYGRFDPQAVTALLAAAGHPLSHYAIRLD